MLKRGHGFIFLFIAILFYLQYRLWLGQDGLLQMFKLKKALVVQTEANKNMKQQNDEMVFQIKRLQNSHEETESRARNELGMIKKGETFYQVVE